MSRQLVHRDKSAQEIMSQVGRPPLFPCADRVNVPQVGAEIGRVSLRHHHLIGQRVPLEALFCNEVKFNTEYFKRISGDLSFSDDVIRAHAAHSMPYDKSKLDSKVFKVDKSLRKKKTLRTDPVEKLQGKGFEKKHIPCNIHKVSEHKLTPLRVPKFRLNRANREELVLASSDSSIDKKTSDPIFLTESQLEKNWSDQSLPEKEIPPRPSESKTWDSQLLLKLSKNTARWIVSEKTDDGPQRDRLEELMDDIHGVPSGPIDTLIRDDASISDLGVGDNEMLTPSNQLSKSWRRTGVTSSTNKGTLEDREGEEGQLRPKESEPLVSFYRLPFGLRKAQKEVERETARAINATAKDIKIYRRKARPPPTLRDVMNSAVGDKMYDTTNQYEQEWLSGAQQVCKADKAGQVLMDSGNLYQIFRQESYPIHPDTWHSKETKIKGRDRKPMSKATHEHEPQILTKGRQKWKRLPEAIQEEVMSVHEASYKPERQRKPSFSSTKNHRENSALVRIVDEWRSKWNLSNKWYDSSVEDLERDLVDLNEHVRLQAVATIARASTFRPTSEASGDNDVPKLKKPPGGTPVQNETEGILPEKLVRCVEKALSDPSHRVRFTAAIALYTLNRPNVEARSLLNETIRNGTPPERWAAAQCLAHAGVCDSYVVGELVNQLFSTEDIVKHEQCVSLMSGLSEVSSIVHSLVAEQLNSTSWRRRIMACKVLPSLYGAINKDITHKLTNLMWNDWHREVRTVAAQTLGKTGHGKVVHNDLRDRLMEGNERDRIDALYKIGHLGIMTARLLPSYLSCFDDAYIAVRIATVNTAAKLELKDEKVLNKLLFLTQFDSNWKVKAHALKALGAIGVVNDRIADTVVWALRFEAEPGVRAEACETLVCLDIKGREISTVLQDKLLVEPDPTVKRQLALALEAQGVSLSGDMEMVQQIKDEVRRLCTRINIAAKIAQNEEWEAKRENHHEMFDSSPRLSEFEKKHEQRASLPETRPSTKLSHRTSTPALVVTSDDEEGSVDLSLPQTPTSHPSHVAGLDPHIASRLSRAGTPEGTRSASSRLTPAEKLEKLIEVYEGTCSYHEYEQYVRPEGSNGSSHGESGVKKMQDDTKVRGGNGSSSKREVGTRSGGNSEQQAKDREGESAGKESVERQFGNRETDIGVGERNEHSSLGTGAAVGTEETMNEAKDSHQKFRPKDQRNIDSKTPLAEMNRLEVQGIVSGPEKAVDLDSSVDHDGQYSNKSQVVQVETVSREILL